jgi:L-ascorbate metabolism protein UlaG (beta-lactamase superfamily)
MLIALIITIAFILSVIIFMRQNKFGKTPTGQRLPLLNNSSNYKNGKFKNIEHTPDLSEGISFFTVLNDFLFKKNKNSRPPFKIPAHKTNLFTLDSTKNAIIWFGHSSYFMQIDGKTILVDPVFSGNASPVNFTTKSFNGSDVYHCEDIPEIDFLFISHDHWDHLDYDTVIKLKPKIKKIITSLGVGEHLEHWGFEKEIIIEKDWNESVILENGFKVDFTPARHFSGRGFKRAQSLWSSFVFTSPTTKIFIGGDSGYGNHFKNIGDKFGPFDIAILECGQYNLYWKYIHMMPEEVLKAAEDLKAKHLMPVHWGKFSLAMHDWNEPIKRIVSASTQFNTPLFTPKIGQLVYLDEKNEFLPWWETLEN